MVNNSNDLDTAYASFLKQHNQSSELSGVEYIGLNFSEDKNIPVIFKTYYSTSRSIVDLPDLLQPFCDRGMIHALNKIDDTVNKNRFRYEIGLSNRKNENMLWLYRWISDIYPEINCYKEIIKQMTRIKCSDDPSYQLAAMYFLGIIADLKKESTPIVEAVKLHYLLRMCENPEKIGKNYSLRPNEYISILREVFHQEFQKLIDIIEEILNKTSSELWMAAIDFYRSGEVKYKLYIKKISLNICNHLVFILERMNLTNLSEQVRIYQEWLTFHPELEQYGIAICLTEKGQWSLNFYH